MTGTAADRPGSFFSRIRLPHRPIALPGSTIQRGSARFTVLTPRLLRLEWSPEGLFEDRATFAFPTREAPTPHFNLSNADGALVLDTGDLVLCYRQDSGRFSSANLSITVRSMPGPVTWTPGMRNIGNLGGTRRTLDGASGAVKLSAGLLSRDGWALYDDSRSVVFTDDMQWVEARPARDLQDLYFFGYGHDYLGALREYTQFGGEVSLIPRYALGAWWSRYWSYSDKDLMQLVDDFAAHDLPLDVLVLDMDWHTPHSWTGYTWNRELFPDPEEFLRWAHSRGLRVTLNLHPAEGVQPFEEAYPRFAEAVGIDPRSREPVPFRPGDPRFMQNYFEILHHPMEEQGVDFWWLDWQQGDMSDIVGLDPLIWLNHLHFIDSARRGRRPMLYSRWGGLGNHRYYIGFSGDTYAAWQSLAYQPYFTATASNVLYGWWSHDIGGHFGHPSPEMFARWVQYGALSPILRLHSSKDPIAERRPWAYPEPVLEASREAFHLRYRLIPYLYTMARACTDTAVSLCRPLYYTYPEEDAAYAARDCYFLGDNLLAAPIVRPANPETGIASADAWVPPGTWYDYQTGESFTGPRWVRLVGELSRLPLLVREGTILPLAGETSKEAATPGADLALEVFPGQTGSFTLYEDDGETLAYAEGEQEWMPFAMNTEAERCRLSIGPGQGRCSTLPREQGYTIVFREAQRPADVLVGGRSAGWRYDEGARCLDVSVPATSKQDEIVVEVQPGPGGMWVERGERNRSCVLADVRRLLGNASPDVPFDELFAAVAALDHPGRDDALARLGGPLVVGWLNTVLPEADLSTGSIVVAGPADGSEYRLRAIWWLAGTETDSAHVDVTAGGDRVLVSPLAFSGAGGPHIAGVKATVEWKHGTLSYESRTPALCPAIPHWRIAEYDPEGAPTAPELAADPSLRWQAYESDPAELPSLASAYSVQLDEMRSAAVESGNRRAAVAVARVTAEHERSVRIAYSELGEGSLWVNRQEVRKAGPGTAPRLDILPPMGWEASVSASVLLPAGESTILLDMRPALDDPPWHYRVRAALVNEDGTVATGLRFL